MIGMAMEDVTERLATLHRTRREQERERRRMRDRQRRQSMTLEQKEKHLARRRRNYQLRRERKHQGSDHQSGQTDTAFEHGNTGRNNRQVDHLVSQFTVQYDHAVPVGFNQVLQNISTESLRSNGGTESLTYDLAKIQKRLRLIHVKHFARSLKRPLGELTSSNIPIVANLILKGTTEANCKSMTGLRLNRLKRLARTSNSVPNEASEKNHHEETQGQQKPELGVVQPNGDDMSKMPTDNVAIEDKKCSDGNHE
ncbi:uncharacterized protein LOC115728108 [Rhodamnia argentea]|uniref:Uncharacterized protein LOC115728108 n=1 Tax=Rhodamnia argentea TaxID=178133 RepID=A0A8B8MW31_9MYRT|nr:uncharacterized protein LOC115728108 [Rhodamnia argentea]XP_030514303.1 uncharacterized protein LOC115728108 [Rhodamnia argentea]XP_030514304.1 uncharacterized protein LOC115728108 [Rhodamnia argentea]XP_048132106.1 uncharacterized protein LOC115728108 [Rhodamnia argentea]